MTDECLLAWITACSRRHLFCQIFWATSWASSELLPVLSLLSATMMSELFLLRDTSSLNCFFSALVLLWATSPLNCFFLPAKASLIGCPLILNFLWRSTILPSHHRYGCQHREQSNLNLQPDNRHELLWLSTCWVLRFLHPCPIATCGHGAM